jgi:hypothetical protein
MCGLGPASYTRGAPRPTNCGYNAQDPSADGRARLPQEPFPMMRVGFDNERYLAEQSAAIRTRIEECGNKR